MKRMRTATIVAALMLIVPAIDAAVRTDEVQSPEPKRISADEFHTLKYPLTITVNPTYTVMTVYHLCMSDEEHIVVASDTSALLDPRTGKKYHARRIMSGNALMNHDTIIRGMKDQVVAFQIEFDPLPRHTQKICIVGMSCLQKTNTYKYIDKVLELPHLSNLIMEPATPTMATLIARLSEGRTTVGWYSDDMPPRQRAKIDKKKNSPHITGVMKIRPYFTTDMRDKYAAWFTPEATYVAYITTCTTSSASYTFYKTPITPIMVDDQHTVYDITGSAPYPLDTTFTTDTEAGDCIAIIMQFPPVPLDTYQLYFRLISGKNPVRVDVSELLENQYLVQPIKP